MLERQCRASLVQHVTQDIAAQHVGDLDIDEMGRMNSLCFLGDFHTEPPASWGVQQKFDGAGGVQYH